MMKDQARVALVTGGGRGIGLAVAERLRAQGISVVITGRDQERLDRASEALGGPDHVVSVVGDVANPEHQERAAEVALERFGTLTYLVNNAGVLGEPGMLCEIDAVSAQSTIQVDALAPIGWLAAARRVSATALCAVVNVSSIAGRRQAPESGIYGAAKAMLDHVTGQLAAEHAPSIRVNGVAPATVRTSMSEFNFAADEAAFAKRYPLGRIGEPQDVANLVWFLLSDEAAWITGQTFVIDGGLSISSGVTRRQPT